LKLLAKQSNYSKNSQSERLIQNTSKPGQLFKITRQSEQLFKNTIKPGQILKCTSQSEQLFENTSRLYKTARQLERHRLPMPISYHALRLRPNTVYMYEMPI
jgi:hypothetical protein